jgi:hypothetical protein
MKLRRLIILALLVGWVLIGPVALMSGGCVTMVMKCHGLCVITSLPTPTVLIRPQAVAYRQDAPEMHFPTPVVKLLTPPPRSVLFFSLFAAIA